MTEAPLICYFAASCPPMREDYPASKAAQLVNEPMPDPEDVVEFHAWWAKAEAKYRFIFAQAMVDEHERLLKGRIAEAEKRREEIERALRRPPAFPTQF